jgi:hypothetical protein
MTWCELGLTRCVGEQVILVTVVHFRQATIQASRSDLTYEVLQAIGVCRSGSDNSHHRIAPMIFVHPGKDLHSSPVESEVSVSSPVRCSPARIEDCEILIHVDANLREIEGITWSFGQVICEVIVIAEYQ